jgi:hypothetical protein
MYCFLQGTNWIYICYVEESRPPLWASGQSSWLQIQRSGVDSRRYQIFWDVVGLERGPLSLVSTTEELLETKSSGSSLENRDYGRRDPSRWPRGTLYRQELALTSPATGGRSVGLFADSGLIVGLKAGMYRSLCPKVRRLPGNVQLVTLESDIFCPFKAENRSKPCGSQMFLLTMWRPHLTIWGTLFCV